MKLVKSILIINFYTILSRIFGYLRTVVMANYLGTGPMADALSIAIKIPSLLRRILAEGAMNAAFVPTFSGLLTEKGPKAAQGYAREIYSLLLVILLVLTGVVEIFIEPILSIAVPGFAKDPLRMGYLVDYTRIVFPFILFISLAALYSGILSSFDRFAALSASPLFGNMAIILGTFGFLSVTSTPGHAMAWAILISGVVQLLCVSIPARRMNVRLKIQRPTWSPAIKKFFLLLAPTAAGAGVVQVNILIDMAMASYLPTGGVSILNYADRLVQLPLSMLGTAIGMALLPLMSRQFKKNELSEALESQNLSIEYALLFLVPAMLGLLFYAEPIVKVLYESGKFNAQASEQTAYTAMILTMGLPAYVLIKVFTTSFFARHDTKTPVQIALFSVLINVGLNVLLIRPLAHLGLALATAFSAWVNVSLLILMLYRQNLLRPSDRLKRFFPRMLVASALALGGMKLLDPLVLPHMHQSKLVAGVALAGLVFMGIGLFFLACLLTGAVHFPKKIQDAPSKE